MSADEPVATAPASALHLDTAGLVFRVSGGQVCNDCGFDFDAHVFAESDDDPEIPLQLFRGEGKATEMACLCWACAEVRMGKALAE